MSSSIKTISEGKAALSFGTILDRSSQELLGEQLEKPEYQNFIGVEASENFLNQMRNAED